MGSGSGTRRGLSLKTTLAGLFALMAIIACAQGILSVAKLAGIRHEANEVATNWLPSMTALANLRGEVDQVRIKQYRYVTTSDNPRHRAENRQQYLASLATVATARGRYEPLISSDEERGIYGQFGEKWERYVSVSREIEARVEAGRLDEARALLLDPDNLQIYATVREIIL